MFGPTYENGSWRIKSNLIVTAASGTGHNIGTATSFQRDQVGTVCSM